ncbi:DUF58 domain-containing protein [Lysinibacillus odysseyi]|uniref:DUF58 domain-containing protein n=1 Tax=Lysinibacillus odysseyi 34hs-1 = NBRC 100172 TaxID=1220589 RepID=A0A0A3IRL8_9BACI|nr:DUF58 domain-containing protein [Lysinibacillus odysseyi]KGR87409.1 hypothetical protein CD32_03690 [Lysinibacillus odysseyi 34hs-1 = NBRC 100172]
MNARKVIIGMKRGARFLMVVGLLALTFCFAMFQGGFVSWFIFFTLLPFLLYSLLLAMVPVRISKVEREIVPSKLQRGGKAKVTVRFRNHTLLPAVFLLVRELDLDERVYRIAEGRSGQLFFAGWRRSFEWTYELENLHRGEHTLSALEVTVTDFFGWVRKRRVIEQRNTFLVYPHTVEMNYTSLQVHYDQGALAARYAIAKDTTLVTGVRDYQAGDRFSWIHWKSFAKNGELRTKEFEDRQSQKLFVCIDRTASDQFEEVVELTASMLHSIVARNGDVAFLSGGESRVFYPAIRTEVQLEQIMQYLAIVRCDTGLPLEQLLRTERELNSAILILVTGSLTNDLKAFLMNGFKYARAVICFVVVAKEQYASYKGASVRFSNSKVIYITKEMFSQAFTEVNKP